MMVELLRCHFFDIYISSPPPQDPKHFKSEKTGRGQLREGWRDSHQPIMCSYKLVTVKFEVWGLQTRVEQFVHKVSERMSLLGLEIKPLSLL